MTAYEEFPVFFAAGQERLCGVVCSPVGGSPSEGLGVVLLTGGNYTRTHRNRMWVRAAHELAEHGVASMRFDYHGVGDSTGSIALELERPLLEDTMAAADFLLVAAGASRLAFVATCMGGRAAMAAAARRNDVASVTLHPLPIMVPGSAATNPPVRRRVRQWLKRSELGARVLRNPRVKGLRKTVADRREGTALVVSRGFAKDVAAQAKKGVVHFVYGERTEGIGEVERLREVVADQLTHDELARVELEVVPGTTLLRFQSFADQDVVVRAAVDAAMRAIGREKAST